MISKKIISTLAIATTLSPVFIPMSASASTKTQNIPTSIQGDWKYKNSDGNIWEYKIQKYSISFVIKNKKGVVKAKESAPLKKMTIRKEKGANKTFVYRIRKNGAGKLGGDYLNFGVWRMNFHNKGKVTKALALTGFQSKQINIFTKTTPKVSWNSQLKLKGTTPIYGNSYKNMAF